MYLIKSPEFREQILWSDVREELVLVADGRDFFPRAGVKHELGREPERVEGKPRRIHEHAIQPLRKVVLQDWRDRPREVRIRVPLVRARPHKDEGYFACLAVHLLFALLGPEDHTLHRLLEVPLGWVLLAAEVVHQSVPHAVLAVEEGLPFDQLAEAALGIHRAPEAALPLHILVQELRALCHIPLPSSQKAPRRGLVHRSRRETREDFIDLGFFVDRAPLLLLLLLKHGAALHLSTWHLSAHHWWAPSHHPIGLLLTIHHRLLRLLRHRRHGSPPGRRSTPATRLLLLLLLLLWRRLRRSISTVLWWPTVLWPTRT